MNIDPERAPTKLSPAFQRRHVTMIALGGIIGAGLFVGSGASIAATGPAIVISYAIAGLMVMMVMRMLGEMATSVPGHGSFTEYARLGLGNWAGFTTGWLYWYFWAIVVGIEAIAGAQLIHQWIDIPLLGTGALLIVIMVTINMMSTRSYGEFEFWFASIKVAAIIGFIVIAGGYATGIGRVEGPMFGNLVEHGGFAPNGLTAVFAGVASVIFALTGAEITTIAAAESKEPERAIVRMTNSVVWRILIFYVVSIFVIVSILPWSDVVVGLSPFAQALSVIGVPGAATMMNIVVLSAVLSCLNSGLYICSRVLFTLAGHGDAPQSFVALSRNRVPVRSIFLAGGAGLLTVAASIFSPEGIFAFLVNACGSTVLIIYLLICVAQLRLRRKLEREAPERIRLRMWFFPWLTYLTIAAMVAVLVTMAITPELSIQFYLSLLSLAAVLVAYGLVRNRRSRMEPELPAKLEAVMDL